MLHCERLRDAAAFAIRKLSIAGPGVVMELGLISNSALNPSVYWTTLLPPLFSGLADQPGVRTIAPPPLAWEQRSEWSRIRSQVKGCDALFWIQLAARPNGPIHLASYLNLGARRSNFVLDAWKPSLTKIGLAATIERLDPCFIAYREAVDELKTRFPLAKFVWLPFGAHTDVFYPRKAEKSIFAFWLGRRYEPLHQALLAYCEARGLRYVYPQGEGLTTEEVGRLTSSAQYYVATPPDLNDANRTGGFSPLVMRYFEGLAAGTRLLGVLPRSGEYESVLPMDAFCQVAPDGSDLAERLDEDRSNPNAQLAVNAASAFVRENHSWRRRAEQVFNHLANGAAIDLPLMQKQRHASRAPSRPGFRQDLAHDLKTNEASSPWRG
jgi:Glycosyl transferases group 1